ncbi:poly-gamma-glutamate biosynthesis protein PgsC [Thermotoga profunda]|uniref:poly-gamma-glutamate biosynthesis protein PgsC n=1 Tax=Thermotoga profunda TaxID=1508420 RepID=UPI000597AB35|nr:poly-gamma-glutamate biosynthesis protein PgsC [Thermotoga profunda]
MFEIAAIGILISTFFVELTGLYPGGIIVPVWLSFYVDQPYRILCTTLISFACLLVYKVLRRHLFLYTRRRFILMILLSTFFTLLFRKFVPLAGLQPIELQTIGWVIPGLLANTMERQGIFITLISVCAVSVTIRLVVMLVL